MTGTERGEFRGSDGRRPNGRDLARAMGPEMLTEGKPATEGGQEIGGRPTASGAFYDEPGGRGEPSLPRPQILPFAL